MRILPLFLPFLIYVIGMALGSSHFSSYKQVRLDNQELQDNFQPANFNVSSAKSRIECAAWASALMRSAPDGEKVNAFTYNATSNECKIGIGSQPNPYKRTLAQTTPPLDPLAVDSSSQQNLTKTFDGLFIINKGDQPLSTIFDSELFKSDLFGFWHITDTHILHYNEHGERANAIIIPVQEYPMKPTIMPSIDGFYSPDFMSTGYIEYVLPSQITVSSYTMLGWINPGPIPFRKSPMFSFTSDGKWNSGFSLFSAQNLNNQPHMKENLRNGPFHMPYVNFTDKWTYLGATFSGTDEFIAYVNGSWFYNKTFLEVMYNDLNTVWIGKFSSHYALGQIASMEFYTRALFPEEIEKNFQESPNWMT